MERAIKKNFQNPNNATQVLVKAVYVGSNINKTKSYQQKQSQCRAGDEILQPVAILYLYSQKLSDILENDNTYPT